MCMGMYLRVCMFVCMCMCMCVCMCVYMCGGGIYQYVYALEYVRAHEHTCANTSAHEYSIYIESEITDRKYFLYSAELF